MATGKTRKPRRQKAVIDRIEEGKWAVLLVGREQRERVVPLEELPEGMQTGAWLKVRLGEQGVEDVVVDEEETAKVRGRVESKLEQLRGRQQRFKPISAAQVQDGSNRLQNPPASKAASDEPPAVADRLDADELEEWVDEGGAPSEKETGEE
jgi:hypothetical protein